MRPLRVVTWHVHGNYLLSLSRANVEFYLPVKPGRPEGYGGRGTTFAFPERVHDVVALEVWGRDAESMGGWRELQLMQLAALQCRYRFFFNPIRWTSLALAVIEAMMLGMPVVGLATTEMATVIENGVSGYVDTDI